MSYLIDVTEIVPGAVIYRRADVKGKQWYARFETGDRKRRYRVESTRTENRNEAIAYTVARSKALKAAQAPIDDQPVMSPGGIKRVLFRDAAQEYLDLLRKSFGEKKFKGYRTVLERYAVPYFGDRLVSDITSRDITKFKAWRKSYYTTGPGAEEEERLYIRAGKPVKQKVRVKKVPAGVTINNELSALSKFLQWCVDQDYLDEERAPRIKRESQDDNPRPAFTRAEYLHLRTVAQERFREAADAAHARGVNWRLDLTAYHRRLLLHYITLMWTSGARPSDLTPKYFRWEDVEKERDPNTGKWCVTLYLRAKRRKGRCVPAWSAIHAVNALMFFSDSQNPKQPVFPVKSFKRSFDNLLKAAGLMYDRDGKKRTAYSLRSGYITQRLLMGDEVATVARNCRTSEAMIERFYNKLDPIMKRVSLMREH